MSWRLRCERGVPPRQQRLLPLRSGRDIAQFLLLRSKELARNAADETQLSLPSSHRPNLSSVSPDDDACSAAWASGRPLFFAREGGFDSIGRRRQGKVMFRRESPLVPTSYPIQPRSIGPPQLRAHLAPPSTGRPSLPRPWSKWRSRRRTWCGWCCNS